MKTGGTRLAVLTLVAVVSAFGAARAETPFMELIAEDERLVFQGNDIVSMSWIMDGVLTLDGVQVRLDPSFDGQVANLTKDRIGQEIAVIICGHEVMRGTLSTEIPTADFTLDLGSDETLSGEIAAMLQSKTCPPQS